MEAGLLSDLLRDCQGGMGVGVKDFMGPLRHALTGERVRESTNVDTASANTYPRSDQVWSRSCWF